MWHIHVHVALSPGVITTDPILKVLGERILTEAKRKCDNYISQESLSHSPLDLFTFYIVMLIFNFVISTVFPSVLDCDHLFVKYQDHISKLIPIPSIIAEDLLLYGFLEKAEYFKVCKPTTVSIPE